MKTILTLLCAILLWGSTPTQAQTRMADSLALVMLYDSTGGASWTTPWNLNQPMDTWNGVVLLNGRVGSIYLGGRGLVGILPNLNLQACTILDLYPNSLSGSIPNFSNLPNLEELILRYNNLNGSIPDFSNLPSLIKLFIDNNNLSGSIPDFSNMSNLILMNIGYNPNISGTLPDFSNLPNLESFSVQNTSITGSIPNFSSLSSLISLSLDHNDLNGVIPDFSNMSSLTSLSLHNNNLSGVALNISKNISLQIQFQYNDLTFEDLLPVYDSLIANVTNFTHSPQDSIGTATTVNQAIGSNYTIDLVVDDTVTSNVYTWYKGTTLHTTINGNNELSFTNLQAGDAGIYTCHVTNPNIPNLTLKSRPVMINVGATGVEKVRETQLVVAPNPVQSLLTVQSNTTEAATLQIINTAGQVLQVWKGEGQLGYTLDISSYPAGIYIVELTTAQQKLTKKIIKQ